MVSSCDILVVGGGVAGVPAAVTAARAGKNVVLVERDDFLGGTGVSALHRYICGLYLNGPKRPEKPLNDGFPGEVLDRLLARAPGSRPLQMGRCWGFPFEPARLRSIYEELVQNETNIMHLASTSLESVQTQDNRIVSVTVQTATGPMELAPRAVIDATGTGAVIRLSGAPFALAPEPELQPSVITVHFDGIDGDRKLLAVSIPWQLGHLYAVEKVELLPFEGFAPGCGERDGFCKFSVPHEIAHDQEAINQRLATVQKLMAKHIPELRKIKVIGHSRIMDREGIRLAGEWELDAESILQARKFPGSIARNAWPLENWAPRASTPTYEYPPDGDYYEIPASTLHSRAISNLLATGRCISASSKALSSIRPMGTCMALGEAAAKEAMYEI